MSSTTNLFYHWHTGVSIEDGGVRADVCTLKGILSLDYEPDLPPFSFIDLPVAMND
jgi:hypothetical protein